MKPVVLTVSVVSFLVGGGITFAVVKWLGIGSPELAFVVGAILGTQLAAVAHHRIPGATNSTGFKASVGGALATSAIALGIVLHAVFTPFQYVGISVPIAAFGAFVFPFVIFDTMWKALSKKTGA
jgi:hypothetical protein